MSDLHVMTVNQPCCLCEKTQEVWRLYQDRETRAEHWVIQPVEHLCPGMTALVKERALSQLNRASK